MASQGPNSPGTGANSSPGPGNDALGVWVNPGNVVSDNGSYAQSTSSTGSVLTDDGAQLIVGGSRVGTSAHTNTSLVNNTTDQTYTFGGPTSLFGTTLTDSQVNASNFGFAFAAESTGGSGTNWLHATNFGFSVPAGATIDGVEARVAWGQTASAGSRFARVDHVTLTVHYTPAGSGISIPVAMNHYRQQGIA